MFKNIKTFIRQRQMIDALLDQVKALSEELVIQKQNYQTLFDEFCEQLKRNPMEVTVREVEIKNHVEGSNCPACKGTCTFQGFDWSRENIIAPIILNKNKPGD